MIDYDGNGEQNIFFEFDNDVDRYNDYMVKITETATDFVQAEEELNTLMQKLSDDFGISEDDIYYFLEN